MDRTGIKPALSVTVVVACYGRLDKLLVAGLFGLGLPSAKSWEPCTCTVPVRWTFALAERYMYFGEKLKTAHQIAIDALFVKECGSGSAAPHVRSDGPTDVSAQDPTLPSLRRAAGQSRAPVSKSSSSKSPVTTSLCTLSLPVRLRDVLSPFETLVLHPYRITNIEYL